MYMCMCMCLLYCFLVGPFLGLFSKSYHLIYENTLTFAKIFKASKRLQFFPKLHETECLLYVSMQTGVLPAF